MVDKVNFFPTTGCPNAPNLAPALGRESASMPVPLQRVPFRSPGPSAPSPGVRGSATNPKPKTVREPKRSAQCHTSPSGTGPTADMHLETRHKGAVSATPPSAASELYAGSTAGGRGGRPRGLPGQVGVSPRAHHHAAGRSAAPGRQRPAAEDRGEAPPFQGVQPGQPQSSPRRREDTSPAPPGGGRRATPVSGFPTEAEAGGAERARGARGGGLAGAAQPCPAQPSLRGPGARSVPRLPAGPAGRDDSARGTHRAAAQGPGSRR